LERQLDRALDVLAREARFASVSHRLDLSGLCRDCAGA
jgi:Fe2+ or Zn2+ uptake regulation protein